MSPTVDALRNEIRVAVGRYEREVSSGFTKEALAAICEALECEPASDPGVRPSSDDRRAAIREAVGADGGSGQFRKAELQAIADALREE